MLTRVHQIYAAATSTGGDNVANIMVPYKGTIIGAILQVSTASGVAGQAELSFQSANQLTTNDATSLLVSATFGAVFDDHQANVYGIAIPIDSISKIYAHITLGSSIAWKLKGTLFIATKG